MNPVIWNDYVLGARDRDAAATMHPVPPRAAPTQRDHFRIAYCRQGADDRRRIRYRSAAATALSRTLAPFTISSGFVNSRGEWLMPPTLGTKIIAIGAMCAIS